MSTASIPQLLTLEDLERIPDPPGGRYELHHGEAVFVSFPDRKHKELQRRLRKLLETFVESADAQGVVDTEFPYRPLPQHELWGADVAWCSQSRYDAIDKWLDGSPELVIEVKSPSNSKAELQDKAMTTLAAEAVSSGLSITRSERSRSIARGPGCSCTAPVGLFLCLTAR